MQKSDFSAFFALGAQLVRLVLLEQLVFLARRPEKQKKAVTRLGFPPEYHTYINL